jgi:hypothetical protein
MTWALFFLYIFKDFKMNTSRYPEAQSEPRVKKSIWILKWIDYPPFCFRASVSAQGLRLRRTLPLPSSHVFPPQPRPTFQFSNVQSDCARWSFHCTTPEKSWSITVKSRTDQSATIWAGPPRRSPDGGFPVRCSRCRQRQ